jgi:hypothetical protein
LCDGPDDRRRMQRRWPLLVVRERVPVARSLLALTAPRSN